MQQFTPAEWQSWERFYRANFINSLTGFKSASLIGTINAQGVPNLGMFSSMVHIGSDPALIGYINRPLAAAPHTLANIKSNGFYTVNHIHPSFVDKAHPFLVPVYPICSLNKLSMVFLASISSATGLPFKINFNFSFAIGIGTRLSAAKVFTKTDGVK